MGWGEGVIVADVSTLIATTVRLLLSINKHMWGEEKLQNIIDKRTVAARKKAVERSKRKRIGEDESDNNEGNIEDV